MISTIFHYSLYCYCPTVSCLLVISTATLTFTLLLGVLLHIFFWLVWITLIIIGKDSTTKKTVSLTLNYNALFFRGNFVYLFRYHSQRTKFLCGNQLIYG